MKKFLLKRLFGDVILSLLVLSLMWRQALPVVNTKIGTFDIIMFLSIVYFLLSLPISIEKAKSRKYALGSTMMFLLPIILFMINVLFSFIYTIDTNASLKGVVRYSLTFATIIAIAFAVESEQSIIRLFKLIAINTVVLALLAIIESVFIVRLFPNSSFNIRFYNSRNFLGLSFPFLFYHNTNNLAVALLTSLPACIVAIETSFESKRCRCLLISSITLLVLGVALLAESRGAMLGAAALYLFHYSSHFRVPHAKRIFAAILLIVSIVIVYYVTEILGGFSNIFSYGRFLILKKTYYTFSETGYVGVGVANAELANSLHSFKIKTDAVHNYWAEILLEMGFPAFFSFVIWFIFQIKESSKFRRLGKRSIYTFPALFLITFVFASVVQSSIRLYDNIWMHYGFCGWLLLNKKGAVCVSQEPLQSGVSN